MQFLGQTKRKNKGESRFSEVDQPACAELSNAGQLTAVSRLPALPIDVKRLKSFRFEYLIPFIWFFNMVKEQKWGYRPVVIILDKVRYHNNVLETETRLIYYL